MIKDSGKIWNYRKAETKSNVLVVTVLLQSQVLIDKKGSTFDIMQTAMNNGLSTKNLLLITRTSFSYRRCFSLSDTALGNSVFSAKSNRLFPYSGIWEILKLNIINIKLAKFKGF
jgi:hypothetical protein